MSEDIEEKYLTRVAFARRQRWSASYVTKLGHQGRLVFCPGNSKLIDVPATLSNMGRTGDPGKGSIHNHSDKAASVSEDPSALNSPRYWDARSRREECLAELAGIELRRQQSVLVDRQSVEDAAFATWRMTRDAVMGLPTQLAPEIASMTDAFQIEIKLRDALRQVFADMSKIGAEDLLKVTDVAH